ncbi:FAD-binding protein [Rhodobacterales bacterium HKCCE2091]|nr:FAD-binding protein [Rhodobacterales bacterium HKCCE2091]
MTVLSGWGGYPRIDTEVLRVRDEADVARALDGGPLIPRGNGRSYGDSAIGAGRTLDMRGMDRMLGFADGVLTAEAGVLLSDVIEAFLPRGWFPAVTPGTRFVTLGGAIAADVHGKNHHLDGSFCDFVDWVDMIGPGGAVRRVARDDPGFDWIRGAMGLTGIVLRAGLRLRPVESGWIRQEVRVADTLDEAVEAFESRLDAPYAVAWIDGLARGAALGRSVIAFGRHAARDDLPPEARTDPFAVPRRREVPVPFHLPDFALNRFTVRAFNAANLAAGRRAEAKGPHLVDWARYFYPLDALKHWPRLYGRRGFMQFQCVLPLETSRAGLAALLDRIAAAGLASPLAVLKRMGPQAGRFSFPMEGYTLALDFPVSDRSLALMTALDDITDGHGGRFYLAKDSRLPARRLAATDPRVEAFRAERARSGADRVFASAQSERLKL